MGWTENDVPDQSGRIALVTGANSGLGFHVSRVLAHQGARVLMACRNPVKGREALARVRRAVPAAEVELLDLDLAALASVRTAADETRRRVERIDLLFNNAGVMAVPRQETVDGFETQLATNHLGHFALTGLLLPQLLAAPRARVVSTSSSAHRMGRMAFGDLMGERRYNRWRAYGQSKLANLLFTFELQRRFAASRVPLQAMAAHPGYAATNLQSGLVRGVPLVGPVVGAAFGLLNKAVAQSDREGALPLLMAGTWAQAEGGDYFGPQGRFGARGAPGWTGTSDAARDEAAQRRLWTVSEELTGVTYDVLASA